MESEELKLPVSGIELFRFAVKEISARSKRQKKRVKKIPLGADFFVIF